MNKKLSNKKKQQILKLLETGLPITKVALAVGVGEKIVRRVKKDEFENIKSNGSSETAPGSGGPGDPSDNKSTDPGRGPEPGAQNIAPQEKIEFTGGMKNMNKESDSKEKEYMCECGAQWDGKKANCPSCGIELDQEMYET